MSIGILHGSGSGSLCLALLLLWTSGIGEAGGTDYVRMCYFPAWARSRVNFKAQMTIKDIDPVLCTHVLWAYSHIDTAKGKLESAAPDIEEGLGKLFEKFTNLKIFKPGLKLMMSVGGATAGSDPFEKITENDLSMKAFADNARSWLRYRKFDGLSVDWEYPSIMSSTRFHDLLRYIREAFDADLKSPKLLLTIAVAADVWTVESAYWMEDMHINVDYILVKAFNYHAEGNVAGFNSPLYARPGLDETYNQAWSIHYYLNHTVPAMKLVLGITFAGLRFTLMDINEHEPGSPVLTSGYRRGPLYKIPGYLMYPEVCIMRNNASSRTYWDDIQKAPYIVKDDDFVGYENARSIKEKVAFMKSKQLAGVFAWFMDQDDITGTVCDEGKFPLLKAITRAVLGDDVFPGDGGGGGGGSRGGGGGGDYGNKTNAGSALCRRPSMYLVWLSLLAGGFMSTGVWWFHEYRGLVVS